MKTRSKLMALLGAGVLMLGVAGTALASTETITWDGQMGLTDGQLSDVQCDTSNTPYLYWVLSPSTNITAAELWINGVDQGPMDGSDGNTYKLTTDFFDLSTLEASAVITYSGDLSNGLNLKISHGCPGDETSSSSSSSSSSSTTESSSTTFTGGTSGESTTLPQTSTFDSSNPTDHSWMLIAALGMLLGSALVLAPARARNRR